MRQLIDCKNIGEFREVAKYYDWGSYVDNPKYLTIGIEGNKVDGYANLKWYQNDDTFQGAVTVSFEEWKKLVSKPKENNMKYVVKVASQNEAYAVHKQLGQREESPANFPWCIDGSTGSYSSPEFFAKNTNKYGPVLSFKDWALMFGVEVKPNKTLKLTSDYSAEVNYNTKIVQVGCQSIPFSKVEELAKLIKE